MAVTKIKGTSSFTNLTKYDSFLAGNAAYSPAAFESIASATGTGSSGTITFSSIPSTYTSLQIRFNAITSSNTNFYVRLNGVTTSSYNSHLLEGDGSTVYAVGGASLGLTRMSLGQWNVIVGATYPFSGIIDIHDYTSTTRNTTIRNFVGSDKNGSGAIDLTSGLFIDTSAITSVSFIADQNFTTSTTVALYGIKGA